MNLAHFSDTSPSCDATGRTGRQPAERMANAAKMTCAVLLGVLAVGGPGFADESRPLLTALRTSTPTSLIAFDGDKVAQQTADANGRHAPTGSLRFAGLNQPPRATRRVLSAQFARAITAPTSVQRPVLLAARSSAAPRAAQLSVVSAPRSNGRRIAAGDKSKTTEAKATRVDAPVSSLPPATMKPRVLPSLIKANQAVDLSIATLPELGESSKVVQVRELKLPPTSQALPQWMRDKVVPLDGNFISVPLPAGSKGARVAQNSSAPPVRQPQSPITSSDRLPNQIEVAASTYIVLVTKVDLQTVAIADPNIADVTVVNARALLVNGKAPGITTLVVVDRLGKIRQYQVQVVSSPGGRPSDIAAVIGIEGVSVRQVRDTLILEGEVGTAEEMQRALDVAGIFSPKVINQLSVRGKVDPAAVTALQIQEAIDRPEIAVRVVGKTAILDGTISSEVERQRAEQIARAYSGDVLNLLRLPTMTVEDLRAMMGATDISPIAEAELIGLGTVGATRSAPPLVVRRVGDQVVLEGVLPSQLEVDAMLAAAARTGLQVVNRLQVAPAPTEEAVLLNRVAAAIGIRGVRVRGTAKRLVLEGQVADSNDAVRAGQIALGFAADVDNMLVTPNPLQVNVEVSIVEISKNDIKGLGGSLPNLATAVGQPVANFGFGEGNGNTNIGTTFQAFLSAQISKGNANLLSNPRATVLSGRTTSFQAGGQYPIPVSSNTTGTGVTTVEIEFKDFGVLMDVTPVVTADGAVTMRVRTDITQIDTTLGFVQVTPDVRVPAFTRRAAVTEVTTQSGGTIALSGLIQTITTKTVTEVPFLSKIPILGKLFTSKRFQRGETDLVIFVTPRLLPNVLLPGQVAPTAPIAVGPSTVAATTLGNPGIQTFSTIGGAGVQPGSAAAGGGQ